METLLRHLAAAALLVGVPSLHAADTVEFAADTFIGDEMADWLSISITRTGGNSRASVRLAIVGGTATEGVDYTFSNILSMDGPGTGTIFLYPIDDGVSESDETVILGLVDPTGGMQLGPRVRCTVTIHNSRPTFSIRPYDFHGFYEPLGERFGATTYPVVIERRGDRDTAASVQLRVAGGRDASGEFGIFPAATAGVDFLPLDARVHFAIGETNRIVELGIPDDGLVEGDKWITLKLSEPIGGVLHPTGSIWETALHDNEIPTHLDVKQPPLPLPLEIDGISLDAPDPTLITPLQSGARLFLENGEIVKRLRNGERDPGFKLDATADVWISEHTPSRNLFTEPLDGTLWHANRVAGVLLHFNSDGSLIRSMEVDCSLFPEFPECSGLGSLVGILRDGRLLFRFGDFRMFRLVGERLELDTSFPPLQVNHEAAGFKASLDPFKQEMILSRAWAINGVPVSYYSSHIVRLADLPATALQTGAGPPGPPGHVFFRRLGPSTSPATVHYTTRDHTAKAGEDYLAQNGTLTFAPLEVEKFIELAIIPDDRRQFTEEFEIVITSAEGIAELPAPLRVPIESGLPVIPEVNRIQRLLDGRVLLGGRGDPEKLEYSTDLKAWLPITGQPTAWDSGFRLWLDATATNAPTRYYRAVTP